VSWELRLGDCLAEGGLASLPDASVDHVICDPPYEAEAHTLGRRIKTVGGGGNYGSTGGLALNFEPITSEERELAARAMVRIARRWIVVFCQVEAVAAWRDALEDAGATYKRACAWLKSDAQPQLTGDRPGMGYESVVCAHAPGRSRWNGGGKRGVYESARASTIEGRPALHMTEKPLPLMESLVRDFTDEGELVCDPIRGQRQRRALPASVSAGASSGGRKIRATTKPPVSGWERPASNTNYSLVVPSPANPSSA
jgi:site-specific DNA-methyltransferase (adenine-specific)